MQKKSSKKAPTVLDTKQIQYFDTRYYKVSYREKDELKTKYLPSVTEILNAYPKPFLAKWRGSVGNDKADEVIAEALSLGSFVHYGAEQLLKGGIVVYNPPINSPFTENEIKALQKKHETVLQCHTQEQYVQLYRVWQFLEAVQLKPFCIEHTVFSLKHEYAGTLDLLAWVEEGSYNVAGSTPLNLEAGYYVLDYKTGKSMSYTYYLQLAAYYKAVLEHDADKYAPLRGGLIVHTNNSQVKRGIDGLKTTLVTAEEMNNYFEAFLKVYEVYKLENPVPSPLEFDMPAYLQLNYSTAAKQQSKKRKK